MTSVTHAKKYWCQFDDMCICTYKEWALIKNKLDNKHRCEKCRKQFEVLEREVFGEKYIFMPKHKIVDDSLVDNTYKLAVGDRSGDGHTEYEYVYFRCNTTDALIKDAYYKAIVSSKFSLGNGSKDKRHNAIASSLFALGDSKLEADSIKILEKLGITHEILGVENHLGFWDFSSNPKAVVKLFLELVKTQMENFQYEILEDKVQCLNSQPGFRFNLGYGIYIP